MNLIVPSLAFFVRVLATLGRLFEVLSSCVSLSKTC